MPELRVLDFHIFEETDFPFLAQFARHPTTGELELTLIYDHALFGGAQIDGLGRTYVSVLEALADTADQPVASLDLLIRRSATGWSGRQRRRPGAPTGTLVEWVRDHRRSASRRIALSDGTETVTYGDLDARSNRLARRLRSLGVGAETPVGLCLERGAGLIVGLLAILKAGGAYVPLDPGLSRRPPVLAGRGRRAGAGPDPRAGASRPGGGAGRQPAARGRSGRAEALAVAGPAAPLGLTLSPEQAAYVIYTSGSTGRPKGVHVSHRNVTRLMAATEPRFGFDETTSGRCSTPTPSTSRSGRSGARCSTAAAGGRALLGQPLARGLLRPAGTRAASPCSTRRPRRSAN